ncbi:MAG: penicillin-binding protein 2 [Alphaproteobacteria bacterium]|nr:penicillin-binding protein 2 [Alphaproteobacteria bacterium]
MDDRIQVALDVSYTRLLMTGAMLLFAFGAIAVRLVDVSLLQAASEPRAAFAPRGQEMRMDRADVVDRNGNLLATNLSTASLFANPRKVMDPDDTARQLARVLPTLREAEVARQLKTNRSFVWLQRNLTPRQQWQVISLGLPGIDFQSAQTRVYPNGALAAHIMGYVGVDNQGLAGVEERFDATLRDNAAPLQLTIDIRLQHILRGELLRAKTEFNALGATGVIMDARNGDVLAMTSLPDFDPNDGSNARDNQKFNRATLGVYELGSTFKIFTAAMALDYGIVTMRDGYDATDPIRISRFTIRDYHAKRRWLSVPEIFMYSSNIGAAKMAEDVGGEAQREFLGRLGMLRPASIELPEVGTPMVPSPWRPIKTMTISFGHGLAVSPLQLASGVSAMVNGGTVHRSTLIRRETAEPPQGQRIISERTSRDVRRLMRLVVANGTGRKASAAGYVVGGKTGTADKPKRGGYSRRALLSSFVGAFPMTDPRYVVLATLDEPQGNKSTHGYATGGWVAAPVVRRVIERAAPLLGVQPVDEQSPTVKKKLFIKFKREGRQLASF